MKDATPHFDGETVDHPRDGFRLRRQLDAVRELMKDGEWRTLSRISFELGGKGKLRAPQTSLSARLRDLRKAKFGGHLVERRYVEDGLFVYRLVIPFDTQPNLL